MSLPVTPLLTVDIIIELVDRSPRPIVLIERRAAPYGWALPGGFVDKGERLEHAAQREALEETGLAVTLLTLLGCYSDPTRDPRGATVSAVYIATAQGEPRAADDAKNLAIENPHALSQTLAFDHGLILADYRNYLKNGQRTPLRFADPVNSG